MPNTLQDLYNTIYGNQKNAVQDFEALLVLLIESYKVRKPEFKKRDQVKEEEVAWFTSNQITGMSLYVDRFAGSLKNMPNQLPYLQELGINFLHLMPLFQSPEGESDGGYAVSDFRKIDPRFWYTQRV
jgi:amylosucrase